MFKCYVFLFSLLLTVNPLCAQDSIHTFIFGHSLINHEYQVNPTPSDETSVPHWMHFLAKANGHYFAAGGQYGFLPQHDNLPPFSQWGFDSVDGVWDSDNEAFAETQVGHILITPGNFIQYQEPDKPYYNEPETTPISATKAVFQWCMDQRADMTYYIYENWPDMGGFLSNGFPPTASEWQAYNQNMQGEFHNWFLEYHDSISEAFPNACVKMIPVGPVISKLLEQNPFSSIAVDTLYEDDAPHGRPTIYFLAALTTYMAYYHEKAPVNFTVPSIIDKTIADEYATVVDFIWNELEAFNYTNGESRVFCRARTPIGTQEIDQNSTSIFPSPTSGLIYSPQGMRAKSITLFDPLGRSVAHLPFHNGKADLRQMYPELTHGIFTYLLTDEHGAQHHGKLILTTP